MTNQEIAKLLRNVAASYTIKDEKKYRFQIIAYQKAADSIENNTSEIKDLVNENKLDSVSGIGESIKASLTELITKGKVEHFQDIMKGIPTSVFTLMEIPSFGPKKAYKLVSHFKLKDPNTVIKDVKKLGIENKISTLESFGEKSQADILRVISDYEKGTTKTNRMMLPFAFDLASKIIDYLRKSKYIKEISPLGSLRRMKETIGDIDIAVASNNPNAVIEHFTSYPYKERVLEKGDITASILTSGGKHIDLMVLPFESWGSLLQHFTGSKSHNVRLREYSLKKGYSLSEKGIKIKNTKALKTFRNEEDFYKFLGLSFIPPEIREDQGEIELAIKHKLPKLVELSDIKGDIHTHSNFPIEPSHDLGANTMQEMINKAKELGYEYIGFSEHNPSITNHSKSQFYSIISKKYDKIEQLKKSNKNIRIINLLEVDILASGSLAIDDKSLDLVDAILVSVHSSFSMNKKDMTKRILSGLSHPKAKILSHPTGRMLNQRPGYQVDFDKIFDFVVKNNKALEINAWPERLDLPDNLVREAKKYSVKFVINTDSHALHQMDNMFYGVSVARRGWCEKKDIVNTLPANEFVLRLTH